MTATQNIERANGYDCTTSITKNRFVKAVAGAAVLTVTQCDTTGEIARGVSMFNVSDSEIIRGKGVSVIEDGIAVMEAGGTLVEGSPVMTDSVGRAVAATSGYFILGYCREPAAASGNACSVELSFSGAKVP